MNGLERAGWRAALWSGLLLAACLAAPEGAALAAEDQAGDTLRDRIHEHEERTETHRRERDAYSLAADIWEAVALYKECAKAEDRERNQLRLIREVGALTRCKDERIRRRALVALGEMGSERGARYLKRYLKPVQDDEVDPVTMAAIEAAGEICDDGLVAPLLAIATKSKNLVASVAAAEALGNFGDASLRRRERIARELVKALKKELVSEAMPPEGRPDADADRAPEEGMGATRWEGLASVVPETLDRLTGQEYLSAHDWIAVVDENKRNLRKVFVEKR